MQLVGAVFILENGFGISKCFTAKLLNELLLGCTCVGIQPDINLRLKFSLPARPLPLTLTAMSCQAHRRKLPGKLKLFSLMKNESCCPYLFFLSFCGVMAEHKKSCEVLKPHNPLFSWRAREDSNHRHTV